MVNELPHRRPCVCFALLAALTGRILRAVSAATAGSNARFWWHPSFTTRDDHVAELLLRRKAARYASRRSLVGALHPFLWARPKKWGGKRVLQGPALVPPRRAPRGAMPPAAGRPPHAVWPANIYVPPRAGGPCASRAPRRSIRTGRARGRRQYRRDAPAPRRRGRAGS